MLTNGDALKKIEESCKRENMEVDEQEECKKKIDEIKDEENFALKGFEDQKATLAYLIKAISLELESSYGILRESNPECGRKIANCTGIIYFPMSYKCIYLLVSKPRLRYKS